MQLILQRNSKIRDKSSIFIHLICYNGSFDYTINHYYMATRKTDQRNYYNANRRKLQQRNLYHQIDPSNILVLSQTTISQSTSSILLSSLPSSSSAGMSVSSPPASSSSMLSPSFNILWILPPNWFGSSRLKPEVKSAVS